MNHLDINQIDEFYMRAAIAEAKLARDRDEVPIGCVIVKDDLVISRAHNLKETIQMASGHAEVLAIDRASHRLASWRLTDCTLYVTIEPCAMCAGLIYQARIKRLVFGAADPKGGACGSAMNVLENAYINHRVAVTAGVLRDECATIMQQFFRAKR